MVFVTMMSGCTSCYNSMKAKNNSEELLRRVPATKPAKAYTMNVIGDSTPDKFTMDTDGSVRFIEVDGMPAGEYFQRLGRQNSKLNLEDLTGDPSLTPTRTTK